MIMEPKQAIHYNYFAVFCYFFRYFRYYVPYYVTDIKKLELRLLVVITLLKIESGHAQITVLKIRKPMLKTACINPWHDFPLVVFHTQNTIFVFHIIRKFMLQKFIIPQYRGLSISCFDK